MRHDGIEVYFKAENIVSIKLEALCIKLALYYFNPDFNDVFRPGILSCLRFSQRCDASFCIAHVKASLIMDASVYFWYSTSVICAQYIQHESDLAQVLITLMDGGTVCHKHMVLDMRSPLSF